MRSQELSAALCQDCGESREQGCHMQRRQLEHRYRFLSAAISQWRCAEWLRSTSKFSRQRLGDYECNRDISPVVYQTRGIRLLCSSTLLAAEALRCLSVACQLTRKQNDEIGPTEVGPVLSGLHAHLANLLRARTFNTACTNKLFPAYAFSPAA
jgi:hypothetical protein